MALLGAAFAAPPMPPPEQEAIDRLQDVIDAEIAPRAVEADAVGRYPSASIAALRASGILTTAVPAEFGGLGASHHVALEAQVRLGAADSSVAQIFKIHDELTREIFRYCPDALRPLLAGRILGGAILGLAVAEAGKTVLDPLTTTANAQPDGSYVIDGQKIYTTGAAEADLIAVWAFDPVAGAEDPLAGMQLNLVPPASPGVTIHRDWNALGQRATDSGTITFEGVRTDPALRASQADRWPVVYSPVLYQAGFAAVLIGIGIGALRRAIGRRRPHGAPAGRRADRRPGGRLRPAARDGRPLRRRRRRDGQSNRGGHPRLRLEVGGDASRAAGCQRGVRRHGHALGRTGPWLRPVVA
jgi:alkylation response protein AidB-like acyl-CoA dehydrogenase